MLVVSLDCSEFGRDAIARSGGDQQRERGKREGMAKPESVRTMLEDSERRETRKQSAKEDFFSYIKYTRGEAILQ